MGSRLFNKLSTRLLQNILSLGASMKMVAVHLVFTKGNSKEQEYIFPR
jgi:hypothetical protein